MHSGCHWSAVYLDFKEQTITHLDSFHDSGSSYVDLVLNVLKDEWSALCRDDLDTMALRRNVREE